MYFSINRLDAEKFARLDFTINFGIESHVRKSFCEAIQSGGGYEWTCENVFASVPTI